MARKGTDEGQRPEDGDRHEKARDLAEDALGELAKGREDKADSFIAEAKELDESALEEVVRDLDEDAGSDPKAAEKQPD
ncbi:hypothetical protein [Craurococcus roseus]